MASVLYFPVVIVFYSPSHRLRNSDFTPQGQLSMFKGRTLFTLCFINIHILYFICLCYGLLWRELLILLCVIFCFCAVVLTFSISIRFRYKDYYLLICFRLFTYYLRGFKVVFYTLIPSIKCWRKCAFSMFLKGLRSKPHKNLIFCGLNTMLQS